MGRNDGDLDQPGSTSGRRVHRKFSDVNPGLRRKLGTKIRSQKRIVGQVSILPQDDP